MKTITTIRPPKTQPKISGVITSQLRYVSQME